MFRAIWQIEGGTYLPFKCALHVDDVKYADYQRNVEILETQNPAMKIALFFPATVELAHWSDVEMCSGKNGQRLSKNGFNVIAIDSEARANDAWHRASERWHAGEMMRRDGKSETEQHSKLLPIN